MKISFQQQKGKIFALRVGEEALSVRERTENKSKFKLVLLNLYSAVYN
jgi:hypothetical protein